MNCEVARNLMSLYIDKELNDIEKVDFEEHMSSCIECKNEYELLLEIVLACNDIDEAELPQEFGQELHQELVEVQRISNKGSIKGYIKRVNWKIASGIAAAAIVFAIGTGSGLNNMPSKGVYPEMPMSASDEKLNRGTDGSYGLAAGSPPNVGIAATDGLEKSKIAIEFSENMADTAAAAPKSMQSNIITPKAEMQKTMGRKIIKSGSVALEVENFDAKIDSINKMVASVGGYIENSQVDNFTYDSQGLKEKRKQGNITVRIPSDKFEESFEKIKGSDNVLSENTNGSDITMQYRDTATRVDNLKIQEKSLQALMEKAKNVDEILRIEVELNRVRTEIDLMTGDLKRWDDLVDFSTLNINLVEVKPADLKQVKTDNVWGRAYNSFVKAINNIISGTERLVVSLFAAIPYLVIIGILVVIMRHFVRNRREK